MRGFLVCGFEELPGFLTRAAIAELTGGSALMEKEYVQAEAYAEEYAQGLPVATAEPVMGEVVGVQGSSRQFVFRTLSGNRFDGAGAIQNLPRNGV